jgi:MtrB/PioB family decaheme-associated outer membrane protein
MPRKCSSLFGLGRILLGTFLLPLQWSSVVNAQTSTIEIGALYNSEDSYQFGQYSGLTQSGAFAVGGFSLQSQTDTTNNRYWRVSGKNLGLETGSLSAAYGHWGNFSVSFDFDQLPHYQFNDGRTPFNGSSSPNQTLPSNWVGADSTSGFTALSSNLKQVNIDKNRERFSAGFEWQLNQSWQLMSEYRHETKQGNKPLGAIFGITGGNPRGSIVARPIDYQTDDVTISLGYANQKSQYTLSYNAMHFSNNDKALRFDNPFNNSQWSPGANFSDGAIGQIALEPDTTSSQLSLSGAQSFGNSSRLSASIISTRLEQDDSYLPYSSVFSPTTQLPRTDLDGRVDSLVANLNFSTRLTRQSTLRLRYNFRERDNKTPQEIYLRIPGDAETQGGLLSSQARINRTYDLDRDTFSADVNYRFSASTRLNFGYEYQETDRSMLDVATTEENTGFIKLNFSPTAVSSGSIKFTRSERDASRYDSTVPFIAGTISPDRARQK